MSITLRQPIVDECAAITRASAVRCHLPGLCRRACVLGQPPDDPVCVYVCGTDAARASTSGWRQRDRAHLALQQLVFVARRTRRASALARSFVHAHVYCGKVRVHDGIYKRAPCTACSCKVTPFAVAQCVASEFSCSRVPSPSGQINPEPPRYGVSPSAVVSLWVLNRHGPIGKS